MVFKGLIIVLCKTFFKKEDINHDKEQDLTSESRAFRNIYFQFMQPRYQTWLVDCTSKSYSSIQIVFSFSRTNVRLFLVILFYTNLVYSKYSAKKANRTILWSETNTKGVVSRIPIQGGCKGGELLRKANDIKMLYLSRAICDLFTTLSIYLQTNVKQVQDFY